MRLAHHAHELSNLPDSVFVPTMGALHEGHVALVRHAATMAGGKTRRHPVVVSIFVNPTQFNDQADFARYPRTLDADMALCEAAGADCVFAPGVDEVYPAGKVEAAIALPRVATEPGLEDAHRPGHFAGVCQVVRRLFEMVRPSAAVFGEKDWQQLQVIRALVRQESLGIEIIGRPTVREEDGLAMSSRNRFLSGDQRARALALVRALRAAQAESSPGAAEAAMWMVMQQAEVGVEYAVVREAESLLPERENEPGVARRALVAGRVGSVRLIDNMQWG